MNNFSDSKFTLALCVSHWKEPNKKIEKCNWIPLRVPKGEKNPLKKNGLAGWCGL